jgi:hypothetical protein
VNADAEVSVGRIGDDNMVLLKTIRIMENYMLIKVELNLKYAKFDYDCSLIDADTYILETTFVLQLFKSLRADGWPRNRFFTVILNFCGCLTRLIK